MYWFITKPWAGSVAFWKRRLSHDLSTRNRSKCETCSGLVSSGSQFTSNSSGLTIRSYRGLKLHGCSFVLQPGRALQVLFKRSGPWKITKYLLRHSLPECARTTGNGFLSSLAKTNSIFIVTHFLRQRIHYKYVKKKVARRCYYP